MLTNYLNQAVRAQNKLIWVVTDSNMSFKHVVQPRGVHLKLRLGTTWVRTFDPPYVCTKKSSKNCKKKIEVVKHNLKFLLYKFQKMINCKYF